MTLTQEQSDIITHVCRPNVQNDLTLIDSVAGSGKTSLLVEIANRLQHTNGLYLAYNRSVAIESQRKFPKTTKCQTTHSMAYGCTVKPLNLKLGTFTYRDITEKIKYENKCAIVDSIRSFCLSRHINFKDYADEHGLTPKSVALANKYLNLMQDGTYECTHDFYLKLFHIMLALGNIQYDPFDFIMLDEAGDLNEVTLEIFKLLPSDRKIAVGDKHQNIYQFNDTINCFKVLEGQGTLMKMTKSFRVAAPIAKRIATFCSNYLSPDMAFEGVPLTSKTISTRAYITRTNSALINKMIQLNADNIPYGLVRRAQEIFKLPLMLCALKYQGFITEPAYKHLQADIDNWYEESAISEEFKSPLAYIASLYSEDFQLMQAIRLLQNKGKTLILNTYEEARKHEKGTHNYILATAHSCKGAEFDEVTIGNDLNESVSKIIMGIHNGKTIEDLTPVDVEALNLYYVAVTRCSKELYNAIYL